jgi:drug/metabolite transporter (DMT)-like permease
MLAVIWLGIGPTGIATIILFSVIDRAGPTFLSTINYLVPVVAFFAGAWLLFEPVSWHHFVALATILSGIAITRIRGRAPG